MSLLYFPRFCIASLGIYTASEGGFRKCTLRPSQMTWIFVCFCRKTKLRIIPFSTTHSYIIRRYVKLRRQPYMFGSWRGETYSNIHIELTSLCMMVELFAKIPPYLYLLSLVRPPCQPVHSPLPYMDCLVSLSGTLNLSNTTLQGPLKHPVKVFKESAHRPILS